MFSEAKNGVNYRQGDVIRLGPVVTPTTRTDTTLSTGWDAKPGLGQSVMHWNQLDIPLEDLQVAFRGTIAPGTDETASIRYRDVFTGNTVIEVSRSSFERVVTSWQDYTPFNPNVALRIRAEISTSNGVNSSEFRDPILEIGIKI